MNTTQKIQTRQERKKRRHKEPYNQKSIRIKENMKKQKSISPIIYSRITR